MASPKAEHTVLGICGSFLAQADMGAWGLATVLPFMQVRAFLPSRLTGAKLDLCPHPYTQLLTKFC